MADSADGGKTSIGAVTVHTDRKGKTAFSFRSAESVYDGRFVTATATRLDTYDTSEFSAAKLVT